VTGGHDLASTDRPQIYLISPPVFDLDVFPDTLAAVLDATEVACIRLALASHSEDDLGRAADAVRAVAHSRDVALVIETHLMLAERHGLDGVHLTDGPRLIRDARKVLGADAIVGAYCGSMRHDGLTAAETGADYVAFGPVAATALGSGDFADHDLFSWWSEIIEVPVVAEGALTPELMASLAPVTDFFGIGPEIWVAEDPAAALRSLVAAMG
jgi:thiamine-phosphate pyrophosphorylase